MKDVDYTKHERMLFTFEIFLKYDKQVTILNLLGFFPERNWLLIIVPEGIDFQDRQIPMFQTLTTNCDVTMMPSHFTNIVFQPKKDE